MHITHLLESGVHAKVASEQTWPSSVAVTFDLYSHVGENLQREAASRIDEIVSIRARDQIAGGKWVAKIDFCQYQKPLSH